MESDHERSLVAWANTFTETAPADSLADFATGDALLPIARTIVGDGGNDDDDGGATAPGWAGVFSLMQPAGLVEEDAQVPGNDEPEERLLGLAVTCLEDLLRHTVEEHCLGRETFIRQIMSLDDDMQTSLRQIIVGEQQQQQQSEASSSGVGSPPPRHAEDDVASSSSSSLAGSPGNSGPARSPPAERPGSSTAGESSYGEDDGSLSDKDDLGVKSWYSPHPRSARRSSRGGRTTGDRDRAAPVGPKTKQPRQGRTLDMEEAEQVLVGETAASAASFSLAGAAAAATTDGAAGWTATAVEVSV